MSNQPQNQQPGPMPWQQNHPTQQPAHGQQGQNQQYGQQGQQFGQAQPYDTLQPHGATASQAFDGQGMPAQQQHNLPQGYQQSGPLLGQVRNTWGCIGLFVITVGFYGFYWVYSVYNEMKRFRGNGTGGGLAVLLMFVPFATYFMTPSEVAGLYGSRNRMSPVSGATGLWIFLPIVGGLVWFIKTNDALNDFWRSQGAGQQAVQQRSAISA